MSIVASENAVTACSVDDLIAYSGVAVKIGEQQFALFYLPEESPSLYALANYDPIGGANVMSRGIVGDLKGELVVASPLYKQHFSLTTGACVEDETAVLDTFRTEIVNGQVVIWL